MNFTKWKNVTDDNVRIPIIEQRNNSSIDASIPCAPGEVVQVPSMYDAQIPKIAPQMVRWDPSMEPSAATPAPKKESADPKEPKDSKSDKK